MASRVTALGVLSVLLVIGCQELDPVSPNNAGKLPPRPSHSLSGGSLGVYNTVAIDTAGAVLGSIFLGAVSHAAISANGAAYDLGTLDGSESASTYPMAINNRGAVVGVEWDWPLGRGFLWTPDVPNGTTGSMQPVADGPGGPAQPLDINDAGEMLGEYLASGTGIVLWGCGTVVEVPSPVAGGQVYPRALNDYGQITGTVYDGAGNAHVFLWSPSSPNGCQGSSVLLDPPGIPWSTARALNDFGQVVLDGSDGNARLWTPTSPNASSGSFITLTGPYGPLTSAGMNDRGDVVGSGPGEYEYNCGTTSHIYLWRPIVPNETTGVLVDVTPDIGTGTISFGFPTCYAAASFLGEEQSGTVEVFGSVTDMYGDEFDDQIWPVANLGSAPVASVGWTGFPYEGYALSFDARGTRPYTSTLSFQWDFGDGSSAIGSTPSHVYADNGQYTVRLTATDATGTSSASTVVAIQNLAPTGTFSALPGQLAEGGSYTLSVANISDSPADLPSVQLFLDCGDGSGYQSATVGSSRSCAAPNDGLRTARARLRDKDGATTEYSAVVSIANVAPTVSIVSAPDNITEQTTYTLSFRFTDPGLLDSWSYTVNWGDGTSSAPTIVASQGGTLSATHRSQVSRRGGAKSATYNVVVSVSDNGGGTGSATRSVLVIVK